MNPRLEDLNDELARVQANYLTAKRELKTAEADLWIDPDIDWEQEVGKSKPTQKDKEAWITLQLETRKEQVDEKFVLYQYVQRQYDIAMGELNAK